MSFSPRIANERFLANVREARVCGYDLVCSECGCGITDDTDAHDLVCPLNPELAENTAIAERWLAKQYIAGLPTHSAIERNDSDVAS